MKSYLFAGAIALLLCPRAVEALEAGASRARIAAPRGVPLDGDASRLGRPSSGEHDPLWARALYLDDGETSVFVVSLDLFAVTPRLRANVVERAADLASPEAIILTATHTHNGPGGMAESLPWRWTAGRYHPEMIDTVSDAVVTAMSQAREQKRRATLGYGTAVQRVLSANVRGSEAPIDEQIGVIRVDDADGKAIAILTSFGAMPDLVPEPDFYRFSADFPGAYCREMEALTEPGCVAMFLNGAAAGQRAVDPERNEGWARIDSIGRLLAVRAKAVANEMVFHDAKLTVMHREVPVPEGIGEAYLPPTALIQLIGVEGLLVAFVPGIITAEVARDLRATAIAAGYEAQMSAGPANGYLGALVSRAAWAAPEHVDLPNWLGPDAGDWLVGQVAALVAGEPYAETPPASAGAAEREALPGGVLLSLRGGAYARGYQRGAEMRDLIPGLYEARVAGAVRGGAWLPPGDGWLLWPPFLDRVPVALPALAQSVRPRLAGLGEHWIDELRGFSGGAGIAPDAAWLLQNAPAQEGPDGGQPVGHTMMAHLGGAKSNGGPLVACTLGSGLFERPAAARVEPETGRYFLQAGLDGIWGVMAGMNDAGVVVAIARDPAAAAHSNGPPLPLIARETLQFDATYESALERLRAANHAAGHRVLLVGPSREGWRGAVLTYGRSVAVREQSEGLLVAVDPEEHYPDEDARERYALAAARFGDVAEADAGALQAFLRERGPDQVDDGGAWNTGVRHGAVFSPSRLRAGLAFAAADGQLGEFTEVVLKKAPRNE